MPCTSLSIFWQSWTSYVGCGWRNDQLLDEEDFLRYEKMWIQSRFCSTCHNWPDSIGVSSEWFSTGSRDIQRKFLHYYHQMQSSCSAFFENKDGSIPKDVSRLPCNNFLAFLGTLCQPKWPNCEKDHCHLNPCFLKTSCWGACGSKAVWHDYLSDIEPFASSEKEESIKQDWWHFRCYTVQVVHPY